MVKVVFVLVSFSVSLNALASGNVNSSIRFPVKTDSQEIKIDNFKCESEESLKSCIERFKATKKMKSKGGEM